MKSDGSWWQMKHYIMHFIMLQYTISQPLNETRYLYETGCYSRQYGIIIKPDPAA